MINLNLDKSKTYLLALSAGADSFALAHYLKANNYKFFIAHINYQTRNESDYEDELVKQFAGDIPCFITKVKYQKEDGNFEAWARNVRYRVFKEIVEKYQLEGCLCAHHLDDLLETYFLQKERGYVSYYGLKTHTYIEGIKIIRPLLHLRKSDLLSYCKENNIEYSFDVTNDDVNYKRNKIRHTIINNLTQDEIDSLLKEIEEKNKNIAAMDKIIDEIKEDLIFADILKLEKEVQIRLIFRLINNIDDSLTFSSSHIEEIIEKLKNKDGNVIIDIKNNIKLIKEYNCLKLVNINTYNYKVVVEKPTIVENQYIYFDLLTSPNAFYIKEDSYPLTIENVKMDDIVKIGKINKKVNRLLIENKIPYTKRLLWPKISDKNGKIIFVPKTIKDDNSLFLVKDIKCML